jgi:hypothetical protein
VRSWILVTGTPEAGKTTFACRLIKSFRSRPLDVMRLHSEAEVKEVTRLKISKKNREQQEFFTAGAADVDVFVAPPGKDHEAIKAYMDGAYLFGSENAILFEGDAVGRYLTCDVTVFVMPVHEEGDDPYPLTPLKVPGLRELLGIEEDEDGPDLEELEDLEEDDEGEIIAELTEEQAKVLALNLAGVLLENRPRPEYESLTRANVVVINRRAGDRPDDVAYTASRVRRMLADRHHRASLHVCDLSDPRDPDLKKAVARVKRLM